MPVRSAFALPGRITCLVGCRAVTVTIGLILIVAVVITIVVVIIAVIIALIRADFLIYGFIPPSHIPWPARYLTFEMSTDVI
jgi:hypothetical protein